MNEPSQPLIGEDPATSRALPSWAYTDPAHFAREREAIFFRSWQYAGAAATLAQPGDYRVVSVLEQEVLIVRGDDGALRAFHNVCQHRGHPLLAGCGRTTAITCPYHAWSYRLDGSLRTARGLEKRAGFDAECSRLSAVRVDVLADRFVFINLDADALPLAHYAAGLEQDLRRDVVDFDRLQVIERAPPADGRIFPVDTTINANWKVVIDNCLECYHCRPIHPAFRQLIDMDSFEVRAHDWWASLKGVAAEPSPIPASARNRRYGFWWLWPNTFFEMAPGGAHGITVGSQVPVDVARTRSGSSDRYAVAGAPLFEPRGYGDLNLVPEDRAAMEAVQRGMASRGFRAGRFSVDPDNGETSEAGVHRFQLLVARALNLA